MRRIASVLVLVLATSLVAVTGERPAEAAEDLVRVGSFSTPLHATGPPGSDDIYVVERRGTIQRVTLDGNGRERSRRQFADLSGLVTTDGEGGLFSMAFSPDFAADRRVYVAYTDTGGDTVVDRYTTNTARTVLLTASRTTVIEVAQPASNHNGGMIAFAEDGMLLVGLGDGGGSGDPGNNGQDTTDSLLGSILRLDVKDRGGSGYAIPGDNPFVGRSGDDEIWAYGLRNPWRFSVDPTTGDVWIGDVGQGRVEEVDRLRYRPSTAYNLGWNCFEGTRTFRSGCSRSGKTFPVHQYTHGSGDCSITGGATMRGPDGEAEAGDYIFADFCSGRVWSYDPSTDDARRIATIGGVFGSGQGPDGTPYLTTASAVYRVEGSGTPFRDVDESELFAGDVVRLADEGITSGCSPSGDRFCPEDAVPREQMAAFLARAENLANRAEPFRDVASRNRFAGNIGAIAAADITRGCNPPANDRFCPGDIVTRQQMAAFLVRALELPPARERFRDVASGDLFAADIGALAAAGITRGCNPPANDRFCPDRPVTREQMAAFLVRAYGY